MPIKTLRPAKPGLIVPQPERGNAPLPEDGSPVEIDVYWTRRLLDGDVVEVTPPPSEPGKKTARTSKE